MSAYLIANIDVRNPEKFANYRERVDPVMAKYEGRFLVRGGDLHRIEGNFDLKRLSIAEFPSVEAARRCLDSPEYAPLRQLMAECTTSDIVLVEGWLPPS